MSPRTLGAGVLLGHWDPGSPAWHTARIGRLGASEIAAAMGLSPWQSPFSLWHLKSGNIAPQPERPEMEWGRDLEAVIARRFAREHPDWRLSRCGLYANRDRPWQVAQPDRVVRVGRRRLAALEVKTARYADEWGEEGTDEVPVYYRAQALWQLDTLGWNACWFAVLLTGQDYQEYRVETHDEDIELMRTEAQRFLASVDSGDAPPIDSHKATHWAVRQLHRDIDPDGEVELPPELAETYVAAVSDEKAAIEAKRQTTSRVLGAMGRARRAVCEGTRIAIRVPSGHGAPPHLRPARQSRKAIA